MLESFFSNFPINQITDPVALKELPEFCIRKHAQNPCKMEGKTSWVRRPTSKHAAGNESRVKPLDPGKTPI